MRAEDAGSGQAGPADAEVPAGTRERILAAARAILVDEGYGRLSLDRVAERAGVVRATIYYQFGSKAGLLEGLVSAMELEARVHESRQRDHTVGQLLERVLGLWEAEREVLRIIVSMAGVDPQTEEVVTRHQTGRRQRLVELVDELEAAGRLRVPRDDAIDLLWLVTSFQAYDFLRERTGRAPDEVRRLLETLVASLAEPDGIHP